MKDLLEIYIKEIEVILNMLGVYKGDKIINTDLTSNEVNKKFIKEKMFQLHSGNIDENFLNQAIDELLPYLYEK